MKTKDKSEFCQGYLCAVSALIQMHQGVETQTRELFKAGAGAYNLSKMRKWGIDEGDIAVFEKYKKELI